MVLILGFKKSYLYRIWSLVVLVAQHRSSLPFVTLTLTLSPLLSLFFAFSRYCLCPNQKDDWKRQKVQDHKFDFIDVEDYVDNSPWRKFKYSLVFAIVIKGILIYCADLW